MTLDELMTSCADIARKIFDQEGVCDAVWLAELKSGEILPIGTPFFDNASKDAIAALLRKKFRELGVERYVFISEAWVVATPDLDFQMPLEGLVNHPDRREVVMLTAEDKTRSITGSMYILRPEHGKAMLAPLKISKSDRPTGRLANMLKGGLP